MSEQLCNINLPIMAKDIFRVLALKSIADSPSELVQHLNDDSIFSMYLNGVDATERLARPQPFSYNHEEGIVKVGNWTHLSDMTERELCGSKKGFFGKDLGSLGRVIDYELPLDEKRDSARGKVDLVSVTASELFLIEAKKCDSTELPLRAFFEVYTFWLTLRENKSFGRFLETYRKGAYRECSVIPALLLCEGIGNDDSLIYNQLICHNGNGEDANDAIVGLYRRFLELGVRVFTYRDGVVGEPIQVEDKTEKVKSVMKQ